MLDPADNLEEATFLAIEMVRFGVLNAKQWFSHVSGGPMRGSGKLIEPAFYVSRAMLICL